MNAQAARGALALILGLAMTTALGERWTLRNRHLALWGDETGVRAIQPTGSAEFATREKPARIVVDGKEIRLDGMPRMRASARAVELVFAVESGTATVRYEIQPDWRFYAKRIAFAPSAPGPIRVNAVHGLALELGGAKVREAGGASALVLSKGDMEFFVAQQNPFLEWSANSDELSVSYRPEMDWSPSDGAFESDRICIGYAKPTGHTLPQLTIGEWQFHADPEEVLRRSPQLDVAMIDAIRRCVGEFLEFKTERSRRVHIPWCENDYQIDLAKPGHAEEYKRILDRAAELGVTDVLYTPQNSAVSRREESRDAWGWESLLWMGYGPKIRENLWKIDRENLHPSVQEMLAYARGRNLRLLAYVYPSLAWTQDTEWTRWSTKPVGGYVGADTGLRSFQGWFVERLVEFAAATGINGFSFDHWWINYEGATSRYAQWYGCRRILSELRRRLPECVIDGRQSYQFSGPWTCVGGTYPHPTAHDEQPASFRANADLHTDRVSADKQRYTSYWYTVRNFTPVEANPGFITHQTQRSGPQGFTTEPFRLRDWDVLGWRYSMLSTIATAPDNLVVNMIPARDLQEFHALSEEDKRWFRKWMDWPDAHRRYVRMCRPILGPPMAGSVDGTSMILGDRGYLFLFNPNTRPVTARFALNEEIGLTSGTHFQLELIEGGIPQTLALGAHGDSVNLELPPKSAWVVEVRPRRLGSSLVGLPGKLSLRGGTATITGASGQVGSRVAARIDTNRTIDKLVVNGRPVVFTSSPQGIEFELEFAGEAFPPFSAAVPFGKTSGEFTIPSWIDEQLGERKKSWPVAATVDDLEATWMGPHRLLLFVHIVDPNENMEVSATLDGQPLTLRKAYNSIFREAPERTFTGWYADVTDLARGLPHRLEVQLPASLEAGRFQSVVFENVEPRITGELAK